MENPFFTESIVVIVVVVGLVTVCFPFNTYHAFNIRFILYIMVIILAKFTYARTHAHTRL